MLPRLASQRNRVEMVYAGIRPATQFQDYQIEFLKEKQWVSVSGIRSTGLSAALGIADYVLNHIKMNWSFLLCYEPNKSQVLEECGYLLHELVANYTNVSLHFRGRNFPVFHPLPKIRTVHLNSKL